MALFSQCIWEGQSYTNLIIGKRFDLIGLRFLARHLVTFDFPRGLVYLKRTRVLESAKVGGADGKQPSGPEIDSTSATAASRRSP